MKICLRGAAFSVLIGGIEGEAFATPVGPPCTGCNDGFYYGQSGCTECTGGAPYDRGEGS